MHFFVEWMLIKHPFFTSLFVLFLFSPFCFLSTPFYSYTQIVNRLCGMAASHVIHLMLIKISFMGISLPSRYFLFLLKATTVLLRLALAKAAGLARGLIFDHSFPELVHPIAHIYLFCPFYILTVPNVYLLTLCLFLCLLLLYPPVYICPLFFHFIYFSLIVNNACIVCVYFFVTSQ